MHGATLKIHRLNLTNVSKHFNQNQQLCLPKYQKKIPYFLNLRYKEQNVFLTFTNPFNWAAMA